MVCTCVQHLYVRVFLLWLKHHIYFSGPVMALALAREDAVQGWRDLLGPKELEAAKTECPDRLQRHYVEMM